MKDQQLSTASNSAANASGKRQLAHSTRRVCIISPHELSRRHGSGSQLIQLYEGSSNFSHIFWQFAHGNETSVEHSSHLHDWPLPKDRIRGAVRKLNAMSGFAYWTDSDELTKRGRSLLYRLGSFNLAHVVVYDERTACKAKSLVQAIGCPFVVHFFDLFQDHGICDKDKTLVWLLSNAKAAVASTVNAREQASKYCETGQLIPNATQFSSRLSKRTLVGKLKLAIVGRPYPGGCIRLAELIAENCKLLDQVEIHYLGAHFNQIPSNLRSHVFNNGHFETAEAYLERLHTMDIGYICGPNGNDMLAKYSMPSRLTEFFALGMPVLFHVACSSATSDILRPINGIGAFTVTSQEKVSKDFDYIKTNYRDVRERAFQYGKKQFCLEGARNKLADLFDFATRSCESFTQTDCD